MSSIITTDRLTSMFSVDEVVRLCEKKINDSVHNVFRILESIFASAYGKSSEPINCRPTLFSPEVAHSHLYVLLR